MPKTDPRVDDYIARQAEFARPILTEIRNRMHAIAPGIEETIKWGAPFFVHAGRPLANMAAFKGHASFGFWQRKEMGLSNEEEGMGQFGRLTSVADLPEEPAFADLVRQAMALAEAGGKPAAPRRTVKPEPEVPDALADALARDEKASSTFDRFPPGARREYCEWVAEAKRPETRDKRVAQTIAWLREGKRRNWKYENC